MKSLIFPLYYLPKKKGLNDTINVKKNAKLEKEKNSFFAFSYMQLLVCVSVRYNDNRRQRKA